MYANGARALVHRLGRRLPARKFREKPRTRAPGTVSGPRRTSPSGRIVGPLCCRPILPARPTDDPAKNVRPFSARWAIRARVVRIGGRPAGRRCHATEGCAITIRRRAQVLFGSIETTTVFFFVVLDGVRINESCIIRVVPNRVTAPYKTEQSGGNGHIAVIVFNVYAERRRNSFSERFPMFRARNPSKNCCNLRGVESIRVVNEESV